MIRGLYEIQGGTIGAEDLREVLDIDHIYATLFVDGGRLHLRLASANDDIDFEGIENRARNRDVGLRRLPEGR